MKVGEFCNQIGVSSNALSRFRGQSGPTKGSGSDAYTGAWEYFTKREMAGLKMPTKRLKTAASGAGGRDAAHPDIPDVHLDGEEA